MSCNICGTSFSEDRAVSFYSDGDNHTCLNCIPLLQAALADEQAKSAGMVQALEDILNPMGYLAREAAKEGGKLNSFAIEVAKTVHTDIARQALSQASERGKAIVEVVEAATNLDCIATLVTQSRVPELEIQGNTPALIVSLRQLKQALDGLERS